MTPARGRRRLETRASSAVGLVWAAAYYLSLLPVLVTQGVNVAYASIGYRWEVDGRRPSGLESIVDPSPGWPPFQVPGIIFVVMATPIAAMAVEMIGRSSRTPSGSQPGMMAFVWMMDALMCVAYSSAFDEDVFWREPAGIAGLVMLASAGVALVVSVVRSVGRLRARRRGEPTGDEPAAVLDPWRARLLRDGAGDR